MCNSAAIHFKVTAVSVRKRWAILIFRAAPFARCANSAAFPPTLSSSSFQMRRAFRFARRRYGWPCDPCHQHSRFQFELVPIIS
jgi:hypothetical protein